MSKQAMGGDSLNVDDVIRPDGIARDIADWYTRWDNSRSVAKSRWKETTSYVYATDTSETGNSINPWSHSTHVPKLTQIHDNLIANYNSALFPHDDWMKWIGDDEESEDKEKREAVEAYLKSKHRQSNFRSTVHQLINDWVLYGNCFCKVEYVNETHEVDGEVISGFTGPRPVRISPYDIVFNPLASDFQHAPKIIRYTKSMGQLHRDAEDNPNSGYYKDILDKMEEFRAMSHTWTSGELDKSMQIMFDGYGSITEYLQSGNVEILEFYGDLYDVHDKKFYKNHVVTVVDRTWVLRKEPLNTYSGFPNIFHSGWRLRPDNLWGMGPLDNLVGMQYLIDHLENARADAFDQMLAPTRVIVGDVEKSGIEPGKPGGEFRIPSGEGSVSNLAPDTTVLNADLQIAQKSADMEMYVGSPREAMGIRTPGEKSATEFAGLEAAASRIFQNKIDYFSQTFLEPMINAEIEEARRNLDGTDIARVMDNDIGVASFLNITKEDITAKGKLVPIGARHFARQNQLSKNMQALMMSLQGDQLMQQHFPSVKLANMWSDLLGVDAFNLVEPYGRVAEQQQFQRLMQAANKQVQSEDATPVGDEEL